MFGSNPSKTPFGSGFSSATSAFGSQTPFGQSTQNTLFGNKTQVNTFGTPSFGTQTSGFGAGTSSSGSLFGTTTSTGGLFGQQQQPTGFSFGQNTGTGSIFGAASQTPGTGLFQTPQQSTTLFSAQKPGFGGFVTSSGTGGLFGSTTTNTPFGQTTATSGLFGGIGFGAGVTGTTVKFNPVQSTEHMQKNGTTIQVQTKHQCITVMKEYEQKSIEELRLEDYAANRKSGSAGLTTGAAGTTGLFGATTTAGSLFGTSGSTLGQSATSGFKAPFGQTTGGLFGQQQQQQPAGGLFGSKPVGTGSIFGTPSTSSTGFGTGGSLFGQTGTTGTGGLFGTQNTASSSGLFGGTSSFGQTQTTSSGGLFGSSFGQPAQQTGGLFGAKPFGVSQPSTTTGTFGTSTFQFGGTSGASTGLFGNPTTTKSLFSFSSGSQPTFGGTNTLGTSGGLFGQTSAGTTGGLFGAQKPSFGNTGTAFGSSFGANSFGTAQGATTGFGATTGLGGGLGSLGTQSTGLGLGTSTLAGVTQNTLALLQHQQTQQRLKALANSPFGDNPLFRNLPGSKSEKSTIISSSLPNKSPSTASHYKVFSKPTLRVKPKPISSPSLGKAKLFEGLDEEDEPSPSTLVPRKNIKKLVIRNKADKEASVDEPESLQLQLRSLIEEEGDDLIIPTPDGAVSPAKGGSQNNIGKVVNGPTQQGTEEDNLDSTVELFNSARKNADSHDKENGTMDDEDNIVRIKLTRSEYYTQPSMAELNQLCQDEHCIVHDFVVGRHGYGEVEFPGETDVYGLNLDEIVFIRRREVELYPDGYPKPPVGQELNKEARITLHKLWPNDKTTHTPIKSPQRLAKSGFLEQLEEKTTEMGAVFIDYRPETGSWVFMVKHFTRYGLNEQLFAEDDAEGKKYLQKAGEDSALLAKQAEKKGTQLRVLGKEDITVHREATEETSRADSRGDLSLDEQEATDMSSQMDDDEDSDLSGEMEPTESAGFTPFSFKQAQVLGVSSRRVQGMKAHLFDESDDSHTVYMSPKEKKLLSVSLILNEKEREKTLLERFDAPDILKESTPTKKWAMSSMVEPEITLRSPQKLPKLSHLLRAPIMTQVQDQKDLTASELLTPDIPMWEERAKLVSAARRPGLCPVEQSVVFGKHGLLADMGAGRSRSTRMGWIQGNKIIHTGNAISKTQSAQEVEDVDMGSHPSIFGSKQSDITADLPSDFSLRVEKIEAKRDIQGGSHLTKEYLQNALKYSDVDGDGDSLPLIRTAPGNEALSSYLEIVDSYRKSVVTGPDVDSLKNEGDVWSLANALWGNLDTTVVGPDLRSRHTIAYEERVQRREAISKWLSSVLEDEISREVENSKFKDNGHLDAIFSLLTGRRIGAACQTALRNRDHRLALLLSQAAGDDAVRTLLRKQLTEWAELKADKFFDSRRLRIYLLLSGMMVVRSAHGVLNLCDELDWKRAFALHLWYYCSANSSVSDAMGEFSRAFKGTDTFESYAAFPTPPYFQGSPEKSAAKDLSYHLLKLYCKRSHRLETILATDTYTGEAIDQQLSWHLHQCLSALGYTHLSGVSHDHLQTSYAAQLESQGLWEWAVFVLLHIKDKMRREAAVTDVITRHCRVETGANEPDLSTAEEFLVNSLEVPPRMIHSAKALSAKSQGLHHEEAIHLLKAGRWNEAHRVVIDQLSASAVIDEEFSYLRELLMHMTYPERCCTIKNWASGGQIFLDYVILREKLDALKKGEVNVTSYMLEDLEADTASLITRIGNMKCQSPKERLCQSEMAKTCSNLMKIVLAEMNSSEDVTDDDVSMWPTSKVAVQVAKLPFTPECNLRELRELISHFTVDLEA